MEEFFINYAENLHVFDPLDRPIYDDSGDDQTTKQAQLKKLIQNLPKIEGDRTRKLTVPLKNT